MEIRVSLRSRDFLLREQPACVEGTDLAGGTLCVPCRSAHSTSKASGLGCGITLDALGCDTPWNRTARKETGGLGGGGKRERVCVIEREGGVGWGSEDEDEEDDDHDGDDEEEDEAQLAAALLRLEHVRHQPVHVVH
eukprot:1141715-Rhodomonas_salina.2